MNQEQHDNNIVQPLAEAQQLLDGRLWDVDRALWVQGKIVVIFLNPQATEHDDLFDVSVTLRALEGGARSLEGASLILTSRGPSGETKSYRERLNKHGLAVFRGVKKGTYQPALKPRGSVASWVHDQTLELVADLQRAFGESLSWHRSTGLAFAATKAEQTRTNRDMSLKATLQSDAGNMLIRFQTDDAAWSGKIVPFTWIALTPESEQVPSLIDVLANQRLDAKDRINAALELGRIGDEGAFVALNNACKDIDSDVREAAKRALRTFEIRTRFFTVLAWDSLSGNYMSEVNLGPSLWQHELNLPEKAFDPEALSPSMGPIIQKSIKCALTESHDLRAWRQVLEHPHVHHRIRDLIEEQTDPALWSERR